MKSHDDDGARIYDRTFLLSPEKRNQVMELWEIQKYGVDSFSDSGYVCIYGMPPAEWYGREIRLLARTVVDCVRDSLGELIGKDVEGVIHSVGSGLKVVSVRRTPARATAQQVLKQFRAVDMPRLSTW